jgi:elongation factor Ts
MTEITAAAVKSLREKTNLPMMECKEALVASGGDEAAAIEYLKKKGKKTEASRAGRETSSGRIAVFTDFAKHAAMVELQCESDPVANNDDFKQLADDLARQLATGPGAATPEALLDQQSPSNPKITLRQQKEELFNRIREVFNVRRIVRVDGVCGAYAHRSGANTLGVLLQVEGGNAELAKDICQHIAAMRPKTLTKEELDPALVDKEREILAEAAKKEGKPDAIIPKMVEGRLRNFFAECVLREQPFVKDNAKSVGQVADEGKMKLVRFIRYELGKD